MFTTGPFLRLTARWLHQWYMHDCPIGWLFINFISKKIDKVIRSLCTTSGTSHPMEQSCMYHSLVVQAGGNVLKLMKTKDKVVKSTKGSSRELTKFFFEIKISSRCLCFLQNLVNLSCMQFNLSINKNCIIHQQEKVEQYCFQSPEIPGFCS